MTIIRQDYRKQRNMWEKFGMRSLAIWLLFGPLYFGMAYSEDVGHKVSAFGGENLCYANVIYRLISVDRVRIGWQAFPEERTLNPGKYFKFQISQGETVSEVLNRLLKGSKYQWELHRGYFVIRPRITTKMFDFLERKVKSVAMENVDVYTIALALNPPLEEIDSAGNLFRMYRRQPTKARFHVKVSEGNLWNAFIQIASQTRSSVICFGREVEFVQDVRDLALTLMQLPRQFSSRNFKIYGDDEFPMSAILKHGERAERPLLIALDSGHSDDSVIANSAMALARVGGLNSMKAVIEQTRWVEDGDKLRLWYCLRKLCDRLSDDGHAGELVTGEVKVSDSDRLIRLADSTQLIAMKSEGLRNAYIQRLQNKQDPITSSARASVLALLLSACKPVPEEVAGGAVEFLLDQQPALLRRRVASHIHHLRDGYQELLCTLMGKEEDKEILWNLIKGIRLVAPKKCLLSALSRKKVIKSFKRRQYDIKIRICDLMYMALYLDAKLPAMTYLETFEARDERISALIQQLNRP